MKVSELSFRNKKGRPGCLTSISEKDTGRFCPGLVDCEGFYHSLCLSYDVVRDGDWRRIRTSEHFRKVDVESWVGGSVETKARSSREH
jgi:hypothetical protein